MYQYTRSPGRQPDAGVLLWKELSLLLALQEPSTVRSDHTTTLPTPEHPRFCSTSRGCLWSHASLTSLAWHKSSVLHIMTAQPRICICFFPDKTFQHNDVKNRAARSHMGPNVSWFQENPCGPSIGRLQPRRRRQGVRIHSISAAMEGVD